MENLALWFQMVLAGLFLSTAVAKWQDMTLHIAIVQDYRIVPKSWSRFFGRAETVVELALAVLLLLGLFRSVALLGAVLLLALYTVAITVNLFRGRTEVSCGCGGAAGTHRLSWWLVLRNAVLMAMAAWASGHVGVLGDLQALFGQASWGEVYGFGFWVIAAMGWLAVLLLALGNELQAIRSKTHELMAKQ